MRTHLLYEEKVLKIFFPLLCKRLQNHKNIESHRLQLLVVTVVVTTTTRTKGKQNPIPPHPL